MKFRFYAGLFLVCVAGVALVLLNLNHRDTDRIASNVSQRQSAIAGGKNLGWDVASTNISVSPFAVVALTNKLFRTTEALWREAKVHVDLGMPAIKVISALTRVGANILGKQRDLGTVEPGKLADIIVVNGNPLYDITALAHVETVVKGGKVVKSPRP